MIDHLKPQSITGIKTLAKDLKRRDGLPLHIAQDRASQQAGYGNYRHALKELGRAGGHSEQLQAFWHDPSVNEDGIETLRITLSSDWRRLMPLSRFQCARAMHPFEEFGCPGLLYMTQQPSRQHARRLLTRAALTLQFATATKLVPWKSNRHSMTIREDGRPDRFPGADHAMSWYHPGTGTHLFVNEPYLSMGALDQDERSAWAKRHDFAIVQPEWKGMYRPDLESRLELIAPEAARPLLKSIARHLDQLPALDLGEDHWESISSRFAPPFLGKHDIWQENPPVEEPELVNAVSSLTLPDSTMSPDEIGRRTGRDVVEVLGYSDELGRYWNLGAGKWQSALA